MSNLLKNLLIALGLSVILFVGYVVFIKDGTGGDTSTTSALASPDVALQAQQFLAGINELKSINIEGRIFSDPLFLSLRDFRTDLGSEPDGRRNPFSPLQ